MDIKQMKYFIAVSERKSLASAATVVGISQPSLSQQIKLLEHRLGVELLVRSSRGVELTEAGSVFLAHARNIIAATKVALEEVRLAGSDPVGQVVFGFPSSVSMVLSVPLAETIRQEHPKILFRAVEAMSGFIQEWLTNETVDLAILYDTSNLKNVHSELLLHEELHFFAGADSWPRGIDPGHPLPLRKAAGFDLVLPSKAHGLRSLIDRYCDTIGVKPNVVVEMDSLAQIKTLVARGSAATILAPAAANDFETEGKLLSAPIVEPIIDGPAYLVRNASAMVTRASREVEIITRTVIDDLVRRKIWKGRQAA